VPARLMGTHGGKVSGLVCLKAALNLPATLAAGRQRTGSTVKSKQSIVSFRRCLSTLTETNLLSYSPLKITPLITLISRDGKITHRHGPPRLWGPGPGPLDKTALGYIL